MIEWPEIVAIGTRFPDVEEGTCFGTPALRVKGKFMCRLRTDPDALVVRVIDRADAEALLLGRPDVFFSTPHYDGHAYVLVRLDVVQRDELAELLEDAWRLRASKRTQAAFDAERGASAEERVRERHPRAVLVVREHGLAAQAAQLAGARARHDVAERVLLGLVADPAVLHHERPAPALERAVDALGREVARAAFALRRQELGHARALERAAEALADRGARQRRALGGLVVARPVPPGDLEAWR